MVWHCERALLVPPGPCVTEVGPNLVVSAQTELRAAVVRAMPRDRLQRSGFPGPGSLRPLVWVSLNPLLKA